MDIEVTWLRSPQEFERQPNLHHGTTYDISARKGLIGLLPRKRSIYGLYLAG
jgi:hypothetical protein